MSQHSTRRDMISLAAAVVSTVAGKPAVASSGIPRATTTADAGSLTELAREWHALKPRIEATTTDAVAEPLFERATAIEEEIRSRNARTPADALAMLEVARTDMVQFKFADVAYGESGDDGDRLALSAIDNALRVLRALA